MALGFITPRDGGDVPPPGGGKDTDGHKQTPHDTHASTSGTSPAPLTPGQTERWLAASFDANARRALNESFCLSLKGPVNTPALEQALHDVLNRHEAFRIQFDELEPLQSVQADAAPTIQHVDLSNEADSAAALDRFCAQASVHDFVLTQAPLARVSLLKMGDGSTVVHLVVSHLIFDGWASSVMLEDLATAYQARCRAQAPQWPAAESPLVFGQAETSRWDGPQGQEDLAFWKQALQNAPQPVTLGDRQPPSPRLFTADTLKAQFDGPLLSALQQKAKQAKATLFQVMLTAVAMLVQRRTGQEDMILSIPFASQGLARHGALIGDGVLDLPLRITCRANTSFDALLPHVKSQLLDALEHPLATQGSVARAIGRPSIGSRPPLTGVFFNFNPRVNLNGFAPLQASMVEARKLGLLSQVIFNFYDNVDALTLDLHHSTEFFSPQRASDLVSDLRSVVEGIAGLPAQTRIHGLLKSDWDQLQAFNATDTAYETGLRLGDLIQRTVKQTPQATAVRFEGRSVSYAELNDMAWALARQLRQQGVQPGTLVGVCLDRSVELVAALVGVVYSGGAYVPLDPAYPKDRLSNMCEDASMQIVVTRQTEWARAGAAFPTTARPVWMEHIQPTDADTTLPLVGTPQDPAYVIFTSGSTGRPKGAMNAHEGIVNRLQWMQQEYQLTSADRVIQKTPYSFDVSVWEFFWPLMTGATIVVAKPDGHRDASYLAQLIKAEGVTMLHFVPSMLRLFLEEPGLGSLTSIRQVVCSGEALPIDAVDRFFELLPHAQLGNLYGPTEAAVDVTCWPCRAHDPLGIVPIGRPIANTRMYVLDDALNLLPPGAEGELYIGGIQVGMGYVARPDLTAERFLPDPFNPGGRMYKTGDVGRWLSNGVIEYMGRADHQVKLRGNRIELGEIEAQLMHMPGMTRTVVIAREFGPGDVRLVAYLVNKDKAPSLSEVKAYLATKLPEYMLPQHVVTLDDIPLLPNGKIDRKALPAPAEPQATTGGAYQAPRNDTERVVAQAMQEMLKVQQLGIDDDFFAMGGHSLLAARVIGQINKQLGTQLTLRALFEAPTPAKLAQMIVGQSEGSVQAEDARDPIVHRQDQSTAPLTLMQERIRFIEEMQPGRVVYNAPSAHRLTGPMNLQAFDQAFAEMIRRQPALRTAIVPEGDHYIQKVFDEVQASLLPVEDLSDLPKAQREAVLAQRLEALTAETFDLSQAPLLKMRLFKLADEEHALFFMTHHILWDGWSFDILYTEISSLYESILKGEAPSLAPLSLTYGDYAQWHNEWLKTDELKRQVAYWTQQFADGPMPKVPVGDVPRQYASGGKGSTEWMHLDEPLVEQVRAVAKQTGSTVSIVMMSVYAALMSQWLDDSRPAIGMPFRGRSTPELETIMGFFNNMLPIRLEVQPQLSCLDWIKAVRQTMVAAFASQDAPFELLARELDGQRTGAATRLYQVMFSFQDARQRQTHWGPLAHERIPLLQKGATEDLNLWMVEIPGGIEGGFQYNAELFLPQTIAALRDRFVQALQAVVQAPSQPVASLLQASAADRSQLAQWERPTQQPDSPMLQNMTEQARKAPRAPALRVNEHSLCAADLLSGLQTAQATLSAQLQQQAGKKTLLIVAPHPATAVFVGLAALSGNHPVLLQSSQPDAQAVATLQARGDIAAVISASPLLGGRSDLPWIDLKALIPATCDWLGALQAEAVNTSHQFVDQHAVPLDPVALQAACAGISKLVRLLPSDTSLSIARAEQTGQSLLQALHAWSSGACWSVVPDDQANGTHPWLERIRHDRPGLVHLIGDQWDALTASKDLRLMEFVALMDVQDTRPHWLEKLITSNCTVLSTYSPQNLGLPIAGGLLHSASDSGMCGTPWAPVGLRVVNAQQQPTPIGVSGQAMLGSRSTGSFLRWRADGQLHYLGEQGQELDAVRAALHVVPVAKSTQQASTATEQAIARVWEALLGIPGIGPQDNFFDLGGTSLLAMQAMTRLEAELGRRISAQRMVFDSLGQLAAAYDASTDPAAPACVNYDPASNTSESGLIKKLTHLLKRA